MYRSLFLAAILCVAARAVEIHPDLKGNFDKVGKDETGVSLPSGWMRNDAFKGNGSWSAVSDPERGGHLLSVIGEKGPFSVFTTRGIAATPGTKTTLSLETRGTGSYRIWLYCYGTGGGWVGGNVGSPILAVDKPEWQKQTLKLDIPEKPFPKGNVGLIKVAIEVFKGGNLQFDNLDLAMEVEMQPATETAGGANLRLYLPPIIHATPGLETNIYFANTILATNPANHVFDVTCGKGIQQQERWTFTPGNDDAGDHPLTLDVRDGNNAIIASASTIVRVIASGKKAALDVLIIGDSLTHASIYPAQVATNADADANLSVNLVGSHRPRGEDSPVRHEGYGGWTAQKFTSYYPDKPPAKNRKANSPFLYKDENGKATLDYPRYCREFNNGKAPDVVTILLGCNDVFGCNDENIADRAAFSLKHFDILINMIQDHAPDTQIGILLPVPPAGTQDAFGANYGCGQTRWQYLRNQHYMVEQLLKIYGDREADNIHLLATVTAVDAINGFPGRMVPANKHSKTKVYRLNNGVHPSTPGYQQIGDTLYAWLVHLANRK